MKNFNTSYYDISNYEVYLFMYSKELLKGTISAIILKLLSDQERMYGYEISQKVKELSDGKISLKDGSLYPALQKMTADGLLSFKEEEVGGRIRKYYYITKLGRKEKAAHINELKDFINTLNRLVLDDSGPAKFSLT